MQMYEPVCSGSRVWCPLTKQCEIDCGVKFGSVLSRDASDLDCGTNFAFCGNEETCAKEFTCPASYDGKLL